nr:AtpZ/AtpI family protein [Aquibacillus sediminis]
MNVANNNFPFRKMALTSAILAQLVGVPLIGIFIGNWLDRVCNTKPLFFMLFFLIGIGAGTYGTVQVVKEFTGDD